MPAGSNIFCKNARNRLNLFFYLGILDCIFLSEGTFFVSFNVPVNAGVLTPLFFLHIVRRWFDASDGQVDDEPEKILSKDSKISKFVIQRT